MPVKSMNDDGDVARVPRRDFLRRTNAALVSAGCMGSTMLTTGCSREADVNPIKVGILHSQTGTMAISETSLRDIELLAIEEINAEGGVLGRMLEPVVEDPRSRFTDLFPRRARKLLVDEKVSVVFGCWTSASRKAVLPIFEELDGLLFYPVRYEGNECSPNVVYTGSVPNQQVLPALDWLRSLSGGSKRRFFLVGSDYVFPWTLRHIIKRHFEATYPDTEIVGEAYVPFGQRDFKSVVSEFPASGADVVVNMLNGDSNIYFFNELMEADINAEQLPVISTSIGEDELRSLLPEAVEGHFVASNYFQSIKSPRNQAFLKRFQMEHGEDRVMSDPMEAAYVAVQLWKRAVESAGSPEPEAVRTALKKRIEIEAPGGTVYLDPRNLHLAKRCRVGRIRSDRQFDIVYEAPRVISPDPFPQDAFPGWRCDWTGRGLVKGPDVEIDT